MRRSSCSGKSIIAVIGTRFQLTSRFRFVTRAPAGAIFISLCFFLQFVQGVGCAMLTTSAYALVGILFQRHFGMFMVRWLLGNLFSYAPPNPRSRSLPAAGVHGVCWRSWLHTGTTNWRKSLPCMESFPTHMVPITFITINV